MERLLSATEVCVLLDCSLHTLENWYAFKRADPENEYAQMLPEFVNKEEGARRKRYWKESDIGNLIKFKASIPHGRNGVLGIITQRYSKYSKKGCVKADGNKKDYKKGKRNAREVCQ